LGEAKYQMLDALIEIGNISFLAIGRPESAGCYCKVNAYLKEIISMISDNFDYVIIDGEAGIEQVNRRVMEKVTHLILVSDASKKGLQVVKTVYSVAKELVMFDKTGVIINRIPDVDIPVDTGEIELLSRIPDDRVMSVNDIKGESVFSIDKNALIIQGIKTALERIGID
jgi:CO dehydrogenase maturation factor